MTVFSSPSFDDHEQVVHLHDADSGLRAVVAIHSTALGPAYGGVRCWTYADEQSGIDDALRLSRGMTHKNAAAGLPLGGGKAVIFLGAGGKRSEDLMPAFGRAIDRLGGRYLTAEDVGTSPQDMLAIRSATRYVAGLPASAGGRGDPSPWTAAGVVASLRAALAHRGGDGTLRGRRLAIQGLGHVGQHVAQLAHAGGATLFVADTRAPAVDEAVRRFGATAVPPAEIHALAVDAFVPCAMGGVINESSVGELRAPVVVGGANNQLSTDRLAETLLARDISYVPDFVANAGGIVWIHGDYAGEPLDTVHARLAEIGPRVTELLKRAAQGGDTPLAHAVAYAEQRIARSAPVPAS